MNEKAFKRYKEYEKKILALNEKLAKLRKRKKELELKEETYRYRYC